MSDPVLPSALNLPCELETRLTEYRRQVWQLKLLEALSLAATAIGLALLLVFVFDRIWDSPPWARSLIALLALTICTVIPWSIYRWIWCRRTMGQVARLISRHSPTVGDRLLGVLELVDSPSEQTRSPELCRAAVQQVADDACKWDLTRVLPPARLRLWRRTAGVAALGLIVLAVFVPAAMWNSLLRCVFPWKLIPRYTFAMLEPIPKRLVIPHGEPHRLFITLAKQTKWSPSKAELRMGAQPPLRATLRDQQFEFLLPPQLSEIPSQLVVGDSQHRLTLVPILRPELTSVIANIRLPEYLEQPEELSRDARGGSISIVEGSEATLIAKANRELESASIDGHERPPVVATITSEPTRLQSSRSMTFRWRDHFGLAEKNPFQLNLNHVTDEAPVLSCEGLARQRVLLDIEQLKFQIRVHDDFGVRQVGLEWQGLTPDGEPNTTHGEQILAGGGPKQASLEAAGTFSAKLLNIEPQAIQLRLFAIDYFPNRPRVYSPPFLYFIMDSEQHAIWMTERLNRWHRQALEVRDRELELFETNKELRGMSEEELNSSPTREHIERQAAAERSNASHLANLTLAGEELAIQAARNPEFGVGHLEKLAEMLQLLKDISANRMPSVADLLKKAATASQLACGPNASHTAGQNRGSSAVPKTEASHETKSKPAVPSLVDRETSQQPRDKKSDKVAESSPKPSSPSFRLPATTLDGGGKGNGKRPAAKEMDEAIEAQTDLLAEFDKIANELNKVLANLEGSTLVKRLKEASRAQYRVATDLGKLIDQTFGHKGTQLGAELRGSLNGLTQVEVQGSELVSFIMDDLQAYAERRPLVKFRDVLEEMKEFDVVGSLRQLGSDLPDEQGLSMAQCEFWSDSLDRWAEDLVDPACSGTCPGGKSRGSLPPSIVLEVLQVLEGEVNLREDTRVTEQAKSALSAEQFDERAAPLSSTQNTLRERIDAVEDRIRKLPEGEMLFANEIALMQAVSHVMGDAKEILAVPDSGPKAIAAETEAIELLLKSKRINPGGGGGGAEPGGGGKGTTTDSAIALLGKGTNEKEVRAPRDVSQATGETGTPLPEEYRAGLDEYFNRLTPSGGG